MPSKTLAKTLAIVLSFAAAAVAPPARAADEQVIVPQVDRRDVKLPRIPSNDLLFGLYTGTYSAQNFGSSSVSGVRLGYHITEFFFVEGTYGQTRVSDETFRRILPGGIFSNPEEKLAYYNLNAGFNLLPGEVFVGRKTALASALYLVAGVGSTKFVDQRRQTLSFGVGSRVFLADWAAIQVDMRDHIFSLDLLGERKNTNNLELTLGATFFF